MKPITILSLLTTILLSILPTHFSQNSQHQTCLQPFQCGNLQNIPYPFWGGNRPSYCGGSPNFHLSCLSQSQPPQLNISETVYQLLSINNSTQTLRVVNHDFLNNNTCPALQQTTTLLNAPFEFPSNSNNVSVHYGCSFRQVQGRRNQFNCTSVNGTGTDVLGFYVVNEVGFGNGNGNVSCRNSVVVPVSDDVAGRLQDGSVSLRDGLGEGFEIRWEGNSSSECGSCVGSGGVCGFSQDTLSLACFCADRTYDFVCGVDDLASRSSGGFFNLQGIAIIVSVLGFTCVIVPAMILFCRFSKKSGWNKLSDKESNKIVENFILNHGSLAPKRYTYNEIKKATKSFSHKLGQGGFGSVYKGVLPDNRPIAVKILNDSNAKGEEFINEVASISRTSHVNIVNLLGFCYDKYNRALVYEYMPNNSLDKFIYAGGSSNKERKLEWNKLYEIAVGVARGLEYLHRGCNTGIVHFDIKPQNILLDEKFCPKISDFGLAKLFQNNQSILSSVFGARGTIGYIAPEVFCRNFGAVSYRSDVYSYGMMVLEMAGARKFGETEAKENYNYFPDMIYNQCVACDVEKFNEDNVISKEDVETMRKMFLIGFWCIQTAPSDRPSMSKVVEMFEGSVDFIHVPPKPFLSSPSSSGPHFFSSYTADFTTGTFSEGSLLGQKQTSSDGSLMGQTQTSSDGSLMGQTQASSNGSLMGPTQTSSEGSLMGQKHTSSEGSLLGQKQNFSEGSLDKL